MSLYFSTLCNVNNGLRYCFKMASKVSLERMKQNALLAESTITELKNELKALNKEYNSIKVQQLREENQKLGAAVDAAKSHLVQLEIANGIKQVPVSDQNVNAKDFCQTEQSKLPVINAALAEVKKTQPKKEKKLKGAEKIVPPVFEPPVDIGCLDLRVAKVEDVQKHPDADSLYVLKINCGEEKSRTVCSGLVKHVRMDELQDKLVVLLCNLKPAKMRGVNSEAMVMCASSPEAVEVLSPPANCVPGDLVCCDGYTRQPDTIMNPKKKIFETVAPDLHTNDNLEACYKGVPFNIANKGHVLAKTLKNVSVK